MEYKFSVGLGTSLFSNYPPVGIWVNFDICLEIHIAISIFKKNSANRFFSKDRILLRPGFGKRWESHLISTISQMTVVRCWWCFILFQQIFLQLCRPNIYGCKLLHFFIKGRNGIWFIKNYYVLLYNISTYLSELMWELNELRYVKHMEHSDWHPVTTIQVLAIHISKIHVEFTTAKNSVRYVDK